MVDTCKVIYAEDIDIEDELDLDDDEYGDNELAAFEYAVVLARNDFYKNGDAWVSLTTSQGPMEFPAGHRVRVKIIE